MTGGGLDVVLHIEQTWTAGQAFILGLVQGRQKKSHWTRNRFICKAYGVWNAAFPLSFLLIESLRRYEGHKFSAVFRSIENSKYYIKKLLAFIFANFEDLVNAM